MDLENNDLFLLLLFLENEEKNLFLLLNYLVRYFLYYSIYY